MALIENSFPRWCVSSNGTSDPLHLQLGYLTHEEMVYHTQLWNSLAAQAAQSQDTSISNDKKLLLLEGEIA